MNNLWKLLLVVALGITSCSQPDEFQIQEFVGKWLIIEAKRDGLDQPKWEGLPIDIIQTNADGGVYTVNNSPNDSIWKIDGSWKRLESNSRFLRDEFIDVTYSMDGDQVHLTFFILSTKTCSDFPCTLQVQSQWLFKAVPKS